MKFRKPKSTGFLTLQTNGDAMKTHDGWSGASSRLRAGEDTKLHPTEAQAACGCQHPWAKVRESEFNVKHPAAGDCSECIGNPCNRAISGGPSIEVSESGRHQLRGRCVQPTAQIHVAFGDIGSGSGGFPSHFGQIGSWRCGWLKILGLPGCRTVM